jgi:diguanylate cyclase (GGDEF)-like protein/PAS domain S-box-containing protein
MFDDSMNSGAPAAFGAGLNAFAVDRAPARVLLVEDEPRLLSSLQALLGGKGLEISSAANGAEAMALLEQISFDLAILDLGLPDMSGHAIMDTMNAKQMGASVIVTSGDSGIESAIGALKRGAFDYLRKPYSREELFRTVDNALRQRRLLSENLRMTQQLELSERKHRNLVDSSPDIIFTLDHQGNFTFVNRRVQQLLGYTREELLGQHYSMLIHGDDQKRAHYAFNEGWSRYSLSRNIELRFRSSHADGEMRTFNVELVGIPRIESDDPSETGAEHTSLIGTHGVARDITDRMKADQLISYQAYHDILTDLPNRVLFRDRLNLAILQAKRNNTELALMFIDLDRFKLVNDTMGHAVGDVLLQQAAVRLKSCLRRGDTLARLGGDEFTVVLPELGDRQDAVFVAEKFLESLRQPFELGGQTIHISASIGIAIYPGDGESIDELISNSDIAMYHTKTDGKNGHTFFRREMLDVSTRKVEIEHSLHLALARSELEMYYQPQVDITTNHLIGAEALMRWNHPTRGLLSAGEFLPFAEENGLIIALSDWMLESICRDLLVWNAVGPERLRLSINLSPHYLDRGDFYNKLDTALSFHGIDPSQIEVEVTENICIRNPDTAISQLEKLSQLGVRVAIDDFGTGYSSLSYLHRFPVHTLKIDRSFVIEIHDSSSQFPVVLAIIAIAKGLGLTLVAEGVETLTQLRYLERSGCHLMQGYYFHKPLPQPRILELIKSQTGQSGLFSGFSAFSEI